LPELSYLPNPLVAAPPRLLASLSVGRLQGDELLAGRQNDGDGPKSEIWRAWHDGFCWRCHLLTSPHTPPLQPEMPVVGPVDPCFDTKPDPPRSQLCAQNPSLHPEPQPPPRRSLLSRYILLAGRRSPPHRWSLASTSRQQKPIHNCHHLGSMQLRF
jgi:hypothetical protein